MAALCHPRGDRSAETYWAGCVLRLRRHQYLQDIVPVKVDIGINALSAVVAPWVDNEAIVGMNIPAACQFTLQTNCTVACKYRSWDGSDAYTHVPRLVDSMVARPQSPGRISPVVSAVAV